MPSSQGIGYCVVIFLTLMFKIGAQLSVEEIKLHKDVLLARSRRQLLFPNTTVLQFNMGVGTPTPVKTIVVNWAFQANFQLPWNVTQIPLDILHANTGYDGLSRREIRNMEENNRDDYESNYDSDAKLYHFYKYVEDALNSFGHNGTACVLQTICQIGAEPLHSDDEEDLLHELASFVLNPNNDVLELESQVPGDHETQAYIDAYNHGAEHQNCFPVYDGCSTSVIDMFSKTFQNEIID